MNRLSANLSFLFANLPLEQRFEAAARAGFMAVECNDIFAMSPREVHSALVANDLRIVLLNVAPGPHAGDLGVACVPGREAEASVNFRQALNYAVELKVPAIHYVAGRRPAGVSHGEADAVFLKALTRDAALADEAGIVLTLEPLNSFDRPDYHILSISHALDLISTAGHDNIRLQLDLYHCAKRGECVSSAIASYAGQAAHVQIASYPARSEPVPGGNPDPVAAFPALAAQGYRGWVGCEYQPAGATVAGLNWAEGLTEVLADDWGDAQ